jgi:hypothetical protein
MWGWRLSDSFKVKSVIHRYNRALDSIVDSHTAYEWLLTAAPANALDEWQSSILEAEKQQNIDTSSMDIMHSKIKSSQTLKEILTDIIREDSLSTSKTADNGDNTNWLLEGLDIEDEQ